MNKKAHILVFTLLLFFVGQIEVSASPSAETCFENPNSEQCQENAGEEGSEEPSSSVTEEPTSLGMDIVRSLFALLFVILLIYLLLKWVNKRNKLFKPARTIENLGGISLGQNKSIQIVRIGKRVYSVGVGDSIELLTEITDEETIEELVKSDGTEEPMFKNVMSTIKSNKKSKTHTNTSQSSPSSIQFQQLFKNELDNLQQHRKELIQQHKKKEDSHE
ncbi:flagellar protein [Pontibacillus halophilus JSM 076056 = DSM 19796]|uniref:Flagellar protein n=1 Tax=Pontibacillus halophilus JSM 076056 = DSM 19796 TaxID=1385510 RepID=A0A0A5GIS1_9BACI|nr:flagellar biosynthetic protein FliO [Pontibacillus halophilus]KGX93161.1 flagellar protein [Pontibacillus halophilus JSM 076056 = DSM 19796]